jgi:hypothetical protein
MNTKPRDLPYPSRGGNYVVVRGVLQPEPGPVAEQPEPEPVASPVSVALDGTTTEPPARRTKSPKE